MRVIHAPIFSLLIACTVCLAGEPAKQDLRSYAYVSPSAALIMKEISITEGDLIQFADTGLKKRSIFAIDPGRVYESSEDALRIDVQEAKEGVTLTLTVQQGASTHNMLQRWQMGTLVRLAPTLSPMESRKKLLAAFAQLLGNLKTRFNSDGYRRGEMLD